MIKIERANEPEILKMGLTPKSKGEIALDALCVDYEQGKRKFKDKDFKRSIYAHSSVKKALFNMQHGKCCFCECKTKAVGFLASGDVEHFRPKAGYQQTTEDPLRETGYYWLTYQWDNLLLSCEECNRLFKKNLFPLLEEAKRATNHHHNMSDEIPLFINPTLENPEQYIGFNEYVPYAINDDIRGETTIKLLGLRRTGLLEEKRKAVFNLLNEQLRIIKIAETENKLYDADWQELAQQAKQLIQEMALPQAKYSAMIKAAITNLCSPSSFIAP